MIYIDDGNFNINFDEIYEKSLKTLDGYRSSNYLFSDFLSELSVSGSISLREKESDFYSDFKKETRSHALYRLIGLPIVDRNGEKFFNPGFDPDKKRDDQKKDISLSYIESKTYKENQIYQESSNHFTDILNVFTKSGIESSVLLLSSIKKRAFADSIKNPAIDHLNISKSDLQYSVDMRDSRGNSYFQYKYADGKTPNLPDGLRETRYRFALPIIPDPRICYVVGSDKQVNVPFLLKKGSESAEFKFPSPKIEEVIRERFSKPTTEENLTETEKEITQIVSTFSVTLKGAKYADSDIEAVNALSGVSIKNKNKYYFNFIKFSKELLKILKENINFANSCQNIYNFIPVTNESGPENFLDIKPIYALDPINTNLDKKIVEETRKLIISGIQQSITELSKFFKKSDSPVNPVTVLPGAPSPSSDSVEVKKEELSLETINKERLARSVDMKSAITKIEKLMGEFSGLGIIDFYVIISALYIMDGGALVSFLDDSAYQRAQDSSFNINIPERSLSVVDAYKKLTETMRTLYLTLDTLYLTLP